jgi:hypothetical protein
MPGLKSGTMKRSFIITMLLVIGAVPLKAQVTFEKIFSFWDNSEITGIYPYPDGYLLCGNASNYIEPYVVDNFNFLIKTDTFGDTVFVQTSMFEQGNLREPILIPDGDSVFYLVYAVTEGIHLDKLSIDGDTLKSLIIPQGPVYKISLASDGNFMLASMIETDMLVEKFNSDGIEIWQTTVNVIDSLVFQSGFPSDIIELPGGIIKIAVGYSDSYGRPHNSFIYSFSSEGTYLGKEEVKSHMPGSNLHKLHSFGNDMIAIGTSIQSHFFACRLTESADTIWTNYFYSDSLGYFASLTLNSDSNFVMAGTFMSIINSNLGLVAFTPQGDMLWSRHFSPRTKSYANCIVLCNDGGYAIGGYTGIEPATKSYFVKVDANGLMGGSGIEENTSDDLLQIFPNPASDNLLNFTLNLANDSRLIISIYGMAGNSIMQWIEAGQPGNNIYVLDIRGLGKGMYLFNMKSNDLNLSKKLVVQ